MSAEEDFYFQTLRIDRVQAKLAIADAIVTLADKGRVEDGKGIEALARAFNLMPPSFGVGPGGQEHDHAHGHHGANHGHGPNDHTHPHADAHPHPHPHPHPDSAQPHRHAAAQSDPSGIGLATLIARASAELAEAERGHERTTPTGDDAGSGRLDTPRAPLISRLGLLTSAGATEIRLAVLRAKIALAEAVVAASRRVEEPDVCAWIHSLTIAFDELPAPLIVLAETDSDE